MVRQHHGRHVRLSLGLGAALLLAAQARAEPLVPYAVVGDAIPASLTGKPGDPRRGKAMAANSDKGNCLICHAMPIPEAPAFGDVGPPLDGVGSRLSAGQLRLRVVDPKRLDAQSIMPAFYRVDGLYRVAPAYRDKPILSAQEIEDLVAYLATLTAP